ncbi:MAG: HD domain-containing protein [Candidatus Omnitrophica bacterium]|nr:HD domain-containing protein [Candidatus Omnitrophota bacterium]
MTADLVRNKVEEFIKGLASAVHSNAMYGEDHRLTKEVTSSVYGILAGILAERNEITIGIIGDEVAFEKKPFYETSKRIKSFIDNLQENGFKKITFIQGIERGEILSLLRILNVRIVDVKGEEKIKRIKEKILEARLTHISVGELSQGGGALTDELEDGAVASGKESYEGGIGFLTETYKNIKGNQPLNVNTARQLVGGMINSLLKNKNMLLLLTSTKSHDESMFIHDVNVTVFSLLQAEALGLQKEYLNEIGSAALFHDIGKLSGHAEKETKEEDMTEEEQKKKGQNNVNGAKILLDTPGVSPLAAIVAFEHDIAYDMTGYPEKKYGNKLNLASMIIAISDYYDKLRADSAYQGEGGPERIYEKMMSLSGTRFNPDLLKNFFSLVGIYPPGTLVELDTKEIALVIQSSMIDMKRPQLEVLYDAHGNKYGAPYIANLLEKDRQGKYKWTIERSIIPCEKFKIPEKYS